MNITELINQRITIESAVHSGGGFFLACENLGRMFNISFPAGAFFSFLPKVEIISHTLIPLFMPGSVEPAETTVIECTLTSSV